MASAPITTVEEVPDEGTFLFTVRASDECPTDGRTDEQEAILLRTEDGLVCWRNYCQHFTDVRLDEGSGAPMRNGEIVCANHGAMFERESGLCTFGPCEGAYLNGLDLLVEDGEIYLDDPDYEFVDVGGIERDPVDLSSTSNVEF